MTPPNPSCFSSVDWAFRFRSGGVLEHGYRLRFGRRVHTGFQAQACNARPVKRRRCKDQNVRPSPLNPNRKTFMRRSLEPRATDSHKLSKSGRSPDHYSSRDVLSVLRGCASLYLEEQSRVRSWVCFRRPIHDWGAGSETQHKKAHTPELPRTPTNPKP